MLRIAFVGLVFLTFPPLVVLSRFTPFAALEIQPRFTYGDGHRFQYVQGTLDCLADGRGIGRESMLNLRPPMECQPGESIPSF